MYYNVKAVIDTLLVKTGFKTCLVGLYEANSPDPLEKEKKIKYR